MALQRGEVWLFDCGMMEKVRPVLRAELFLEVEAKVFQWLGKTG